MVMRQNDQKLVNIVNKFRTSHSIEDINFFNSLCYTLLPNNTLSSHLFYKNIDTNASNLKTFIASNGPIYLLKAIGL